MSRSNVLLHPIAAGSPAIIARIERETGRVAIIRRGWPPCLVIRTTK